MKDSDHPQYAEWKLLHEKFREIKDAHKDGVTTDYELEQSDKRQRELMEKITEEMD